ncbi:MAG: cytochrome c biogenesis protein CcdA [Nitrospinota bacterium]
MGDLVRFVGIPVGFGLLGFVEPCSMGANFVFLAYLRERPAPERLRHALTFVLSRALFLGLLGGGVAWLGQSFAAGAFLYSAGLGALYIFLGLMGLGIYFGLFIFPMGDPGAWLQKKAGLSLPMGVAFGLSAPICAAPLFLALLGQAGLAGVANGFMSLALFGLALSAPLLAIAASRRASDLLSRVGSHSARMPLFAGVFLLLVGLWSVVVGWRGFA